MYQVLRACSASRLHSASFGGTASRCRAWQAMRCPPAHAAPAGQLAFPAGCSVRSVSNSCEIQRRSFSAGGTYSSTYAKLRRNKGKAHNSLNWRRVNQIKEQMERELPPFAVRAPPKAAQSVPAATNPRWSSDLQSHLDVRMPSCCVHRTLSAQP